MVPEKFCNTQVPPDAPHPRHTAPTSAHSPPPQPTGFHKPSCPKANRNCHRQLPPKQPPNLFVFWLPDPGRKGTAGMVMLAWITPCTCPCICWHWAHVWELLDLLVQHRYQENTNTNALKTWQAFMSQYLPWVPSASASKGCNKFVAKCIFVIQDLWSGRKLVLHSGYHSNSTWRFTGQENPGSHTSKVTPALQKGNQRLLDKAPPGQQPHFLHWIRLWAT